MSSNSDRFGTETGNPGLAQSDGAGLFVDREDGSRHLTVIALNAYAADPEAMRERSAVAGHLAGCVRCSQTYEALCADKAGFLARHPFDQSAISPARPTILRFPAQRIYALAASLVIMVAGVYFYAGRQPTTVYRTKGDVAIRLFVRNDQGKAVERAGHVYAPGEHIQVTYSCGPANLFALFSADTAGNVTTYYPPSGDRPVELAAGADLPLPNSIELDGYIGPELYIACFASALFSVNSVREAIMQAVAEAGRVDSIVVSPGNGVIVRTVLISKQERAR